jgi:hypothetical protein
MSLWFYQAEGLAKGSVRGTKMKLAQLKVL